jgi:hypothetical protein
MHEVILPESLCSGSFCNVFPQQPTSIELPDECINIATNNVVQKEVYIYFKGRFLKKSDIGYRIYSKNEHWTGF